MTREQGPVEVMTRRQAEALVAAGIFDSSGMDPVVDHIFDPGALGLVKRRGSLRLVTNSPRTLEELQDSIRILAEDAKHDPEGAEALLQLDFPLSTGLNLPTKPAGSGLTDLIEDWNT